MLVQGLSEVELLGTVPSADIYTFHPVVAHAGDLQTIWEGEKMTMGQEEAKYLQSHQ